MWRLDERTLPVSTTVQVVRLGKIAESSLHAHSHHSCIIRQCANLCYASTLANDLTDTWSTYSVFTKSRHPENMIVASKKIMASNIVLLMLATAGLSGMYPH